MMSVQEPTNNKYYYIRCSDGGCLSMSEERFEFLVNLMPTLRFLLLGHPNMKPKEFVVLENGVPILELPVDFGVSQKAFLLLINCVLEAKPLPPRSNNNKGTSTSDDAVVLLEETMTILGGCEVLEERLRDHHANPLSPEEDINDDYEWQVLHQSLTTDITMDMMDQFSNGGFEYINSTEVGIMMTHLYRKNKNKGRRKN